MKVLNLIPETDKKAAKPWSRQQVKEVTIEKIRQLPYRYLICFYLGLKKQLMILDKEKDGNQVSHYLSKTLYDDFYWKSYIAEKCLMKELRKRSLDNLKILATSNPRNVVSKALLHHLEKFEKSE